MPVTVAVHDGLDGDFLLLDSTKPSIGYIEYPTGAVYMQGQDQVGRVTFVCRRPIPPM